MQNSDSTKKLTVSSMKSFIINNKILTVQGIINILLIVIIIILLRPQYVPLAIDLELNDMSIITARLDEVQIKYKDKANTILVDINDLVKAKMAIAVDLSRSQPDYNWTDVFSNTSFTMTNDVKRQKFNHAKASALEKALEDGMDYIENATLDLYIKLKSELEIKNQRESSVILTLELEKDMVLNQEEIDDATGRLPNTPSFR